MSTRDHLLESFLASVHLKEILCLMLVPQLVRQLPLLVNLDKTR
ncbi:hypothetical protein C1752_00941 [Acaryochloris thomasi RCC1774]|uniref:Uncharacterized protein n=1 Tax=Acaryochloris thomasi RCC1774 TaxID=1764569 RepID=A0A2W1JNP8_9CYAN|nr:hypothetical protein C1752_00941 [Acaryochloris thomasi RCC1774]